MRCIFCRSDSSLSRSVEHIIPYSLGNTKHVLRAGIVCDACNNYFSREVERPFLEAPAIKQLRFYQGLESRKGRIPMIRCFMSPGFAVDVRESTDSGLSIGVPTEAVPHFLSAKTGSLYIPLSGKPPVENVISRCVAKVALEAMANRISYSQEGLDYICDEKQLDPLRDHARRGKLRGWPVHSRTIYDPESTQVEEGVDLGQVLHEFDFLVTSTNEWYFVLAIFGLELTINMGGPELEGYERWLSENNGASPLYSDRNAGSPMPSRRLDIK